MSSGEKAKPPATFEERNPFDISRRSGPEVAAEIAKRMAAWKQARARTNPAPTTAPSGDAKPSPPIAAPVQPARMPKPAAQPSQPGRAAPTTGRAGGSGAPRVPYFASASATRRAMPPAPSLKQGGARRPASTGDEPMARVEEPAPPAPAIERAALDQQSVRAADAAASDIPVEKRVADAVSAGAIEMTPPAAEAAPARVQPEPSDLHPFESPAEASAPAQPDENESRRAEARAIKARWIAAHDLDALLERPDAGAAADATQAVDAVAAASRHAGMAAAHDAGASEDPGPPARQPQGREEDLVRSSTEVPDAASWPDNGSGTTARVGDEPALPATPVAEPQTTAASVRPIAGREAQVLDIAALDEIAGRREPTFDAPVARPEALDAAPEASVEAPDEGLAPLRADPDAAEAPDTTMTPRDAEEQPAPGIGALDTMAGRKEPTFDAPLQPAASGRTAEAQDDGARASVARAAAEPAPALSAQVEATNELPALGVDALDRAAGRKEPTFDEPVRPAIATPAAAQKAAAPINLRPIETRIEARRVDTLRADPQLAVRRPIFPHIEPEEWDVPPAVAARAQRARRGTSWAIGLGSVLLIAGITAPAAVWQQGRQVQDQAALVGPAPTAPQTAAGTPATGATTAQLPAQATLPEAPQAETPPPEAPQAVTPPPEAPAVAAQQPSTTQQPSAAAQVEPKPDAAKSATDHAAADAQPAPKLRAIGEGDDVNEAPVVAPPTPMVNLASKTGAASAGTPMVARPFVPEQGDGRFLRAPTTGTASVPVAGGGAKPRLIGQLKPRASTVASVSKPVASKPVQRKPKPFFQQSPDQMFQTLIDTLSEGKPVNPATKPMSPSDRR